MTTPLTVEQQFARYREHGDPQALASVFDAVAPEVYKIALHFAHNAAEAEDLLQDTFLVAIETADRYDPAQALVPWLLGILVNKVREARRRSVRSQRSVGAREQLVPDPAEAALARERTATLQQALLGLPEPYRSVLEMHVREDLEPARIAERLQRSPSTVRTQLQRGLEMLRRLLPASAALAIMPVSTRGLDAVRASVLAKAQGVKVAGAAVGGATAGTVAKLFVAIGLVAALVLVLPAVIGDPSPESLTSPQEVTGVIAFDTPALPATQLSSASREAASRPVMQATQPSNVAVLRGRCVDAATSAVLPGCTIVLNGWSRGDDQVAQFGSVAWESPMPVTGDAEGRFAVRTEPPRAFTFVLTVRAPGRADSAYHFNELRKGQDLDLGDVPMRAGYPFRGRVVDQDQQPVADAMTTLVIEGLKGCQPPQNLCMLNLVSNAEGRLLPLAASSWIGEGLLPVGVEPLGHRGFFHISSLVNGRQQPVLEKLSAPATTEVVDGVGMREITIVVARRPYISGVLVDAEGRPFAGVYVQGQSAGHEPPARSATERDGTFVLVNTDRRAAPVEVAAEAGAENEPTRVPVACPWGSRDLRLVVKRSAPATTPSLVLSVREAGTGRPIEEYAAGWRAVPKGQGGAGGPLQAPGPHPRGRCVLEHMTPGNVMVTVVPREGHERFVGFVEVPAQGAVEHSIEVRRTTRVSVRVVGAAGQAIPASKVELIEPREPPTFSVDSHVAILLYNPTWQSHAQWDQGSTDADGRVQLMAPVSDQQLIVRVKGASHAATLSKPFTVDKAPFDREILVRIVTGATLRCTIKPLEVLGIAPHLRLAHARQSDGREYIMLGTNGTVPFPAIGKLELTGLPSGRYQLQLSVSFDGGMLQIPYVFAPDCGSVELVEGKATDATIDAARFQPGALTGRITYEGKPLADARGDLIGRAFEPGATPHLMQGPLVLDALGKLALRAVLPGEYRLRLMVGGTWRAHPDLIRVEPGAKLDIEQAWTKDTPIWSPR